MTERPQPAGLLSRAAPVLQKRVGVMRKAVSFALIGLINTAVDATVFFLVYAYLTGSAPLTRLFAAAAGLCRCGAAEDLALVAANVTAWLVAMTFSYVMNSTITFAAEFGPQAEVQSLRGVCRIRRARRHRQYGHARPRRPGSAGLGGEGVRHPGEFRRELLDVALRGVPRKTAGCLGLMRT